MASSNQKEPPHNNQPRAKDDQEPRIIILMMMMSMKESRSVRIAQSGRSKPKSKDVDRVIKGSPWSFRNSWLILKRWTRGVDPMEISFNFVAVWIQIWGLPLHCCTKKMGLKVGECMGHACDADVYEIQEESSTVLLPFVVSLAMMIRSCDAKEAVEEEDRRLGPWMRAAQFGRKINVEYYNMWKDKGHTGTGTMRKNKAMSKELMDQLTRLTMNDKGDSEPPKTQSKPHKDDGEPKLVVPVSPTKSLIINPPHANEPEHTLSNFATTSNEVLQDVTNVQNLAAKEGKRWKRVRGETRGTENKENRNTNLECLKRKTLWK
ncbi:hypothetical protein SESBI_24244 [Sesbania bispinosa]|nr:hypothetical protein SESBI_24244 [Sesbania bispinosa]